MKHSTWRKLMMEHGLYLSWFVSMIAVLGSLYFSEIRKFIPCNLCWYQRIFMYPLVILLGMAAVRRDYRQAHYVLPLAAIGWLISLIHYLMQKTNLFQAVENAACGIVPCSGQYINVFGFITIPFLAFIAFSIIIVLQVCILRASSKK